MSAHPVLVSYSNYGYFPFLANMLINLSKKLTNHSVHIYCLDKETAEGVVKLNLPLRLTVDLLMVDVSKDLQDYGSQGYNKITHTKLHILADALQKHGFIHFIDADVVCIKEPAAEFYEEYKDYDIVFQHDTGYFTKEKPHRHRWDTWTCTGNMSLRNTPGTMALLNKIYQYQQLYPSKNDQECLLQYFEDKNIKDIREETCAKLYCYPYELYTNGYAIGYKIFGIEETYFFHANHCVGREKKIELLKTVGEWYIA